VKHALELGIYSLYRMHFEGSKVQMVKRL